jgi:hypothetical protein
MTPDEAAVLAGPFHHPAAAALIIEAANAPGWERRERSRRALAILNPDRPMVDGLQLGGSVPEWAEAIGLAGLLVALCREAARVRELREGEAA